MTAVEVGSRPQSNVRKLIPNNTLHSVLLISRQLRSLILLAGIVTSGFCSWWLKAKTFALDKSGFRSVSDRQKARECASLSMFLHKQFC